MNQQIFSNQALDTRKVYNEANLYLIGKIPSLNRIIYATFLDSIGCC